MKANIGIIVVFAISQCSSVFGAASFFGIGDLQGGPFDSSINAVNSDGTVFVGTGTSGSGAEAFVWTRSNGFQGLGNLPGGLGSFGNGVSADGRFVVGHCTTASGNTAFLWNKLTGMVALPRLPGGSQATALDVSADGWVVVGGSDSIESTDGNMEAARWDLGVVSAIGDLPGGSVEGIAQAISDSGSVIAGYSISGDGLEAFRWSQPDGLQGLGDLPTNPFSLISEAMALSASGQYIAGYARGKSGYYEAALWDEHQDISSMGRQSPDLYGTFANGVSNDGSVVVGESNGRAFIWTEANGLVDLKDSLQQK